MLKHFRFINFNIYLVLQCSDDELKSVTSEGTSQSNKLSLSSRKKRRMSASTDSDTCNKILEKACSQLEEIGQRRRMDDSQAFGLNVAKSLRLIPEASDRALCKLKTQELLVQYQLYPPSKQGQQSKQSNVNASNCSQQPATYLAQLNNFTPYHTDLYMQPPK